MAEAGLQAPDIPAPLLPPAWPDPAQQVQQPAQPTQQVYQPSQQGQQLVLLHWSHFKLEFFGKPDDDAEGHLLKTNDWD